MILIALSNQFSICKLSSIQGLDISKHYMFLSITDNEISLVCDTGKIPNNVIECERGWRCLKIDGVLDFSLTGIISKISGIIASQNLGIFVVSTFNTDYIFMKEDQFELGKQLLIKEGYKIVSE